MYGLKPAAVSWFTGSCMCCRSLFAFEIQGYSLPSGSCPDRMPLSDVTSSCNPIWARSWGVVGVELCEEADKVSPKAGTQQTLQATPSHSGIVCHVSCRTGPASGTSVMC
jgi:hypothetical protein